MHYKRWRHYNNVSGKRCQKNANLVFCKFGGFRLNGHVPHAHGLVVGEACNVFAVQQEVWLMCCILVAFKCPQNCFLATLKIRTLPSSLPRLKSWPSDRNFPPKAASRNFVKLLWTSFESGLKIWTWKSI